jgi:hypothetical protein
MMTAAILCWCVFPLLNPFGATLVEASGHQQVKDSQVSQAQKDRRHRGFKSARELLLQYKVPFDPDDLLEHDWRRKLQQTLDSMPEMKEVRYETRPLSGVYIADTLYLPEHVAIAGDTVMIVRYLVFEGSKPVMAGPHALHMFKILPASVLGTSMTDALNRAGVPATSERVPSFSLIKGKIPIQPHPIQIDLSGPPGTKGAKGHDAP